MKTYLMVLGLFLLSTSAQASYLKLLDPAHPQISSGLSLGSTETRSTTMVALVTHNHSDSYLILPGVDWAPLAVGGNLFGPEKHFSLGPSCNLLPTAQSALKLIVEAVTSEDKYTNLKELLTPAANGPGDITGAFGINLEHQFSDTNWSHWKAKFYVGGAWHF